MNVIHLIGNIGREIELRTVGNTKVGKFSLATSRTYTNKEGERVTEKQWHDIEAWGKQAEVLERYTDKGHKLQVSGELRYDKYTNKDGVEVTRAKVRLASFEFLQSRDGANQIPSTSPAAPAITIASAGGGALGDDDDLPF